MTKKFDIKEIKEHEEDVLVFSKNGCPQCVFLKKYFDDNGVSYTEVNINEYEEKAVDYIRDNFGTSLPVCVYNTDSYFTGFNPVKAQEAVSVVKV